MKRVHHGCAALMAFFPSCIPEPRVRPSATDASVDGALDDAIALPDGRAGIDASGAIPGDAVEAADGDSRDASSMDGAQGDDATCRDGSALGDAGCLAGASPRLRSPLTGTVTSARRPRLRWFAGEPAGEVTVTLCRDRRCSLEVQTFRAIGTEASPPADLGAGVWFWRVSAAASGAMVPIPSATWQVRVAPQATNAATWIGAPDVDGDGREDVVIGAPGANDGAGQVYVYSGMRLDSPRWILEPPVAAGTGFGTLVRNLGDLDGDGFPEIGVASVGVPTTRGAITVFRGGLAGPSPSARLTINGERADERLGTTFASLGDTNGDGFGDWGAVSERVGGGTGVVFVWQGSGAGIAATPSWTWRAGADTWDFPRFLAAGDVDADGFSDVVSGAEIATGSLHAIGVAPGSSMGPHLDSPRMTLLPQDRAVDHLGEVVPDLNGDGYPEIAVSSTIPGSRILMLLPGGAAGLEARPYAELQSPGVVSSFRSICIVEDVSGDGLPDIALRVAGMSLGGTMTRVVRVVQSVGGGVRPLTTADALVEGADSCAGADLTGDGVADLVIGDATANTVSVFAGRSGGPSTTPTVVIRSPLASPSGFGASLAR